MTSLFGNPTSTNSLFGNQPSSTGGIFSNQTNQQATSIFGTPSNNNNTLFNLGNNNNNQKTATFNQTSNTNSLCKITFINPIVGNTTTSLFTQPQTQTQNQNQNQQSLFSNTTNTQQNTNPTMSLFQNPNQQNTNAGGGLFGGGFSFQQNTSQNQGTTFPSQGTQEIPQTFISSTKPILSLSSTNLLKYNKLDVLGNEIKDLAKKIQEGLSNNNIHLNYAETLIKKLEDNFSVVQNEGINLVKFSKVLNTKNMKIKMILNNIKNEMKKLNESFEKERDNFKILLNGNDINIIIPNDFLLFLAQDLEERLISYSTQMEDIQTLINLYYSEENGNFNINSDMIEELIVELYKCIKILLTNEAVLDEKVNIIQSQYIDLLKKKGFNEYEIRAKLDGFLG